MWSIFHLRFENNKVTLITTRNLTPTSLSKSIILHVVKGTLNISLSDPAPSPILNSTLQTLTSKDMMMIF